MALVVVLVGGALALRADSLLGVGVALAALVVVLLLTATFVIGPGEMHPHRGESVDTTPGAFGGGGGA